MKRIITFLLIAILLATPVSGEARQEELGLNAQSAVLIDGDTGRVLYAKMAEQIRPMASTTKIMTGILALEYGDLDDVVTASPYAASQPQVHLGVQPGQQFYLRDLLYSLMLSSHNDSAVMIAEHVGTDVAGFARLMNQKAKDLGCEDTYFITPNGLDATATLADGTEVSHSTTAVDLARIMKYCVMESPKKEEFLALTRAPNHTFKSVSGQQSYSCVNYNNLLHMMEGALSGKTGFTSGAGYSYVGALRSEGRTYVLALLGCGWPPHKGYKWSDCRKLFTYGKEHYHYREVFEDLGEMAIPVADGIAADGTTNASVALTLGLAEEEKTLRLLLRESETVRVDKQLPETLRAPVTKHQLVGRIDYYLDGSRIKSWPVFAENSVDAVSFWFYWQKLWQQYAV